MARAEDVGEDVLLRNVDVRIGRSEDHVGVVGASELVDCQSMVKIEWSIGVLEY